MIALGTVAFLIGAIIGAGHHPAYGRAIASDFVKAWARRDYARMYADIDANARRNISMSSFAQLYETAAMTATATRMQVMGRASQRTEALVVVPVRVQTRLFGGLSTSFRLPLRGGGEDTRIAWSRSLEFPGMLPGELLSRTTTMPPRAALLARDGSVLAEGSALSAGQRSSPLGAIASAVVGTVGPIPADRLSTLEQEGVPENAIVGLSGLELTLDDRLRGTPGGDLLAGQRVLASVAPHAATSVRTTISPQLQRAAVEALGGQFGGIVAMKPSGEILAVAGIGLEAVQPPGSTFKMVTVTAALQAGIANPQSQFSYATSTTLDGVKLSNANGESCGGTLANAFAVSCNSVFAPLGVRVGSSRLVATAERYGFNHEPGIEGATESTLPPAAQIQGELDLGSTAIGQGEVQASPLEMATVAATIANGGRRPSPTVTLGARPSLTTVSSPQVAHEVRQMMIDVVRFGTGTAAAIPGVTVAGKTGTAELGLPSSCPKEREAGKEGSASSEPKESATESSQASERCQEQGASKDREDTDAWFATFAPALAPRIVVGVLLVKDGAGGETAAPVARQVLEADGLG